MCVVGNNHVFIYLSSSGMFRDLPVAAAPFLLRLVWVVWATCSVGRWGSGGQLWWGGEVVDASNGVVAW